MSPWTRARAMTSRCIWDVPSTIVSWRAARAGPLDLVCCFGRHHLDRLLLCQRLAERLALARVVQGVGDGPLGEAEAAGAHHPAAGVQREHHPAEGAPLPP